MNMKKSLLAAAVTGALAVPTSAMAVEAYGQINLAILSENDDAATQKNDVGDPPAVTGNEAGELSLADGASRFGFMGEEDLGNGLTASYRYEFSVDATNADIGASDRLSWVALSGDFGQIKAGRMWVGFYNHVGATADLGDIFAAAPGYYALDTAVSRVGNTVEYSGGTDAFDFTVGAVVGPENEATTDPDENEDFDRISISGSFNAGPVNIGIGNVSNSASNGPETNMTGFAVTGSAGNLGYGGSYVMADYDTTPSQEPTAIDVYVSSDFGGGLSGFLGFSQFDNDTANDVGNFTSIWGHIDRALSSRTRLYGEFQSDSIDGGNPVDGSDLDPQRFLVGVNHAF